MARVLLVDDDAAGLPIRTLILEAAGHQVFAASNPEEARTQFNSCRPETVVLDLRLPRPEDGLALIRELRSAAPGLRIVLLSGWTADLGKRDDLQVDEVLRKPVRSEVLLASICKAAT